MVDGIANNGVVAFWLALPLYARDGTAYRRATEPHRAALKRPRIPPCPSRGSVLIAVQYTRDVYLCAHPITALRGMAFPAQDVGAARFAAL